jgi:hypothetical protein
MGVSRRIVDTALVALFLVGIVAPALGTAVGLWTGGLPGENRTMAPPPTLDAGPRQARRQMDAWFNDHFGFRNPLVELHGRVAYRLGISTSRDVVLGRDGWLFYATDRILESRRGVLPFTPAELAAWQAKLEERRDWLAARGIRYVFAVAPEKSSLYAEELPDAWQPLGGYTRTDQLLTWMRSRSTVPTLDFRPALAAAKESDRLYHRTDTHWNDAGAFIAYSEVAAWLARQFPAVRPLARDAFDRQVRVGAAGDLAGMLALGTVLTEERIVLAPKEPSPVEPREPTAVMRSRPYRPRHEPKVFACPTGEIPRAVVVHDSFFQAVQPFLARHFRRSTFLRAVVAPEVIEDEKPDVVIEEMIERVLSRPGFLPESELGTVTAAR